MCDPRPASSHAGGKQAKTHACASVRRKLGLLIVFLTVHHFEEVRVSQIPSRQTKGPQ